MNLAIYSKTALEKYISDGVYMWTEWGLIQIFRLQQWNEGILGVTPYFLKKESYLLKRSNGVDEDEF